MIGQEDAASALGAVERTRRRAFELRGYAHSGDIVLGWGLVWLVCNLATWFGGPVAGLAWPVGVTIGTLWSIVRGSRGTPRGAGGGWRVYASIGAIVGAVALLMQIAEVRNYAQGNAMISLIVAASYVGMGVWTGPRFAWTGLVLAAMVCTGWFLDRAHLDLWLGVGGGGALILTGLWLRRA